jgi:hypothetical protein
MVEIMVSDTGIIISNGKGATISLLGPSISMTGAPIDMNATALTVT